MGATATPTRMRRRRSRRRQTRYPEQLHIVTFRFLPGHGRPALLFTVLVRGKMGQDAAASLAHAQDRPAAGQTRLLTGISTVPAPRPTPALDGLTRRHTAFPGFVALLTAAGGYRPSIRLDLLGRDGLVLALAYDWQQAAWGDPRRAFITGQVPRRATDGAA